MSGTAPDTLLAALAASFEKAIRSADGVVAPCTLLWTDPEAQWKPLVSALQAELPEVYVLGPYDPAIRRGPVIWLKCIVDRTVPNAPPLDRVPVLYLPNVSRQQLRAGADCPLELQPLVELQYRGAVWNQQNGRDWTIYAFLTSSSGLGLDVAQDVRTQEAMRTALAEFAATPLEGFRHKRLESEDFENLLVPDSARDLLNWLNGPDEFQARCDGARWHAFREICRHQYNFDPENDGPLKAGANMVNGGGKWESAWQRFCDAPRTYRGVTKYLKGSGKDLFSRSRLPQVNAEEEEHLRNTLRKVAGFPHQSACQQILQLDKEHRVRRTSVWARLGEAPLAVALEPLSRLATLAQLPLGGTSADAVAKSYAAEGWKCDRAAIEALVSVRALHDRELIEEVVRTLYVKWLDDSSRHFQKLIHDEDPAKHASGVLAEKDTCILFADGLRFDLAGILRERLEERQLRATLTHRIAPLPTVTATAKPLASPAFQACSGPASPQNFTPLISGTDKEASAQRLRDEMARRAVQVLEGNQIEAPTGQAGGGWAETGNIDALGHSEGRVLISQIEHELDSLADRVHALINAGWRKVRIVTDHGWLLIPGGLPKVDLPPYGIETKWSRCAAIKGESKPDAPIYSWYWNQHVRIASPPGIGSFIAGHEYSHGGVSLQECVTPELLVERGASQLTAEIQDIRWRGMRCNIRVATDATGLRVDLRLNYKQPGSTIAASVKELGADGAASLAVSDDRHEGAAAALVVLDPAGNVLTYKSTTVGEEL